MFVTPCVQLCVVDKDTKKCRGCGRSLDQIRNWTRYSDEQRMVIMKELGYGKRVGRQNRLDKGPTQ